jgi:hypothetical protein
MKGWIATPGADNFAHCFGGTDWTVIDADEMAGGPTLLLNLDLADPKLANLRIEKLEMLPICSYINIDLWIEPQYFQIKPELCQVVMVRRSSRYTTIFDRNLRYPNPLPRRSISLRPMSDFEMAVSDADHGRAVDSFVGGRSFIRICGPPLWLQDPEAGVCICGEKQLFVCSIGYELPDTVGSLSDHSFFIGEAALYFFLCGECLILSVISQST